LAVSGDRRAISTAGIVSFVATPQGLVALQRARRCVTPPVAAKRKKLATVTGPIAARAAIGQHSRRSAPVFVGDIQVAQGSNPRKKKAEGARHVNVAHNKAHVAKDEKKKA
jgi:hypothetical protein